GLELRRILARAEDESGEREDESATSTHRRASSSARAALSTARTVRAPWSSATSARRAGGDGARDVEALRLVPAPHHRGVQDLAEPEVAARRVVHVVVLREGRLRRRPLDHVERAAAAGHAVAAGAAEVARDPALHVDDLLRARALDEGAVLLAQGAIRRADQHARRVRHRAAHARDDAAQARLVVLDGVIIVAALVGAV